MIKNLVEIYPDESVRSYLSRIYSHSGFIWNRGFLYEVIGKKVKTVDYNFLNEYTKDFKETLSKDISIEELLLDHTLFKYYVRFLPKEKRKKLYNMAINETARLEHNLPLQVNKESVFLKYCPKCVKEDRAKYGEAYHHIQHNIPTIEVCPKHNCKLIKTNLQIIKSKSAMLQPLEELASSCDIIEYTKEDINCKVSRFVDEIFHQPFEMKSNVLVSDILTAKLDDKYLSSTGRQKKLFLIKEDLDRYYSGLLNYDISRGMLATIYRNEAWNPYDISLLAMFESIKVEDLCGEKRNCQCKKERVKKEIIRLYKEGVSKRQIGFKLGITERKVREILNKV